MNDRLNAAIQNALIDGQLRCASAFRIASDLDIPPLEVGLAADELGIPLSHCQLGLFGYGSKAEGKHKIVEPAEDVPPDLEASLRGAVEGKGITCKRLWEIAAQRGEPKMAMSSACEALGIKVSLCQLGAFPRPKPY